MLLYTHAMLITRSAPQRSAKECAAARASEADSAARRQRVPQRRELVLRDVYELI